MIAPNSVSEKLAIAKKRGVRFKSSNFRNRIRRVRLDLVIRQNHSPRFPLREKYFWNTPICHCPIYGVIGKSGGIVKKIAIYRLWKNGQRPRETIDGYSRLSTAASPPH